MRTSVTQTRAAVLPGDGSCAKRLSRTMRIGFLTVLLLFSVGSATGRADVIVSGNTFLDFGGLDATDNWVVIRTDQIESGMIDNFVPGTNSPGFDTESTLTFIYQVANNGGGTKQVDKLRQACASELLTSWGYFSGWGLTDAGNPVGIGENMGVDTWPDGGGNMRFGGVPGFVQGSYVNPSSTVVIEAGTLDWLEWYFDPALQPESGVSSLLTFTTGVDRWLPLPEAVHGPDGTWAPGGNPAPAPPEPATLAMLGMGMIALLRRRRE